MTDTKNTGHFCWVDLASHDMKSAVEWYGGLFGWKLGNVDESGPGPYGFFQKGDITTAGIGEMTPEMKEGMPPVWNSYVLVDDCASSVTKAKELGAEVVFDTQEVGGGMGKLAFLKDPTGAVFALWQQVGGDSSAARGTTHGQFCWQELATRDIAKAKEFYSALFGWELAPMEGPAPTEVLMVKSNGEEIAHVMLMNEMWEGMPPHWSVYFAVEDTDATCAKAKSTGGKVMVEPTDIPPGRFSVIGDPQGAAFYVIRLNA